MNRVVFAAALVATLAAVAVQGVNTQLLVINGFSVEATGYPQGVIRLRIYPENREGRYEVTDVIVGKEEPLSRVEGACDGKQCIVTHTAAGTALRASVREDGVSVDVAFYPNAAAAASSAPPLVSGVIPMPGEKPEGAFRFPSAERLYGIPERAVDLALKPGLSYRLMNLDVFHYKLDDTGGIYGSIPFLMGHATAADTAGMLWLNSADTKVELAPHDVGADAAAAAAAATPPTTGLGAKWISEAGEIIDVSFFAGPTPALVQRQHAALTGPTMLPPMFALGYHQCRWNYQSTTDSLEVDAGFDTHNIPYDVLWLDIEHTDGKRYFTWDLHNFPKPRELMDALAAKGRKLVTISDPHIKRDDNYHVHKEATEKGFYVKTESGSDFEGHCWPGQSSWVDFYNKNARDWYATLFGFDRYEHSAPNLFTWIDMNEPSVFNAHEVTMDKNAVHRSADGKTVKHGTLHNMYGYYHTIAANQGLIQRSSEPPHKAARPFLLTRSFFPGSQRYAAMWTGDNMAQWDHLVKAVPMLLTLSISNYAFVGADVGGFFFNTPEELMVRWVQAGIFYPFLRGHSHLETKRHEPWKFGDEATRRIRDAIAVRYSLLPYIYTTFREAHVTGGMLIRPLFYEFPHDPRFLNEQEAYMFGPALLVRPVTTEGMSSVSVPLPASEKWFEFPTGTSFAVGTTAALLPVTMETIPMYMRGGFVLPTRERLRRSSVAMQHDPVTLYVALNEHGNAHGSLYLDDEHSFDYEGGAYLLREYSFSEGRLKSTAGERPAAHAGRSFATTVGVERIVVFGLAGAPSAVSISVEAAGGAADAAVAVGTRAAEFQVLPSGAVVVRKPLLPVDAAWTVTFTI